MQDLTRSDSNDLGTAGAARRSERLKRYLRDLSDGQKVVFALNSTVVVIGLCFQVSFFSDYSWAFLFEPYFMREQPLAWFTHLLHLVLVVCPAGVLIAGIANRKIPLESIKKSYAIVLLSVAPLVVSVLFFVLQAWPLIDIALNPRKL
jgi:hypothetical protein